MATNNIKYLVKDKGGSLVPTITPKPTITQPNEVIIRIKAVAINPVDAKMIDSGVRVSSWPFVPGLDGAGIVEELGSEVKKVAVGDEVLALFAAGDRGASYQSFAVAPEGNVVKKPSTWSFEDAASLGVSFITALMSLGSGLKTPLPFLKDGPTTGFTPSSVLILGGSSALGAATIQLLRLAVPDCKILVTSSPKHHSHLRSLGADATIDRSSVTLVADVKSATPDSRGVDGIIDAVGAGSTERHVFDAFAPNGPKKYAQVWTGADEIEVPSGVDSVLFRSRDVVNLQGGENVVSALQILLEGRYKLPLPAQKVGEGLDGLVKALDLVRKGVSGEKLVVSI